MAIQWRTAEPGTSFGLLASTLKSNRGVGAVLSGPPGFGKTVLARTAVERLSQRRTKATVRWLAGTASARQIPFRAFSHLVQIAGVGDSTTLLRGARASLLQSHGAALTLAPPKLLSREWGPSRARASRFLGTGPRIRDWWGRRNDFGGVGHGHRSPSGVTALQLINVLPHSCGHVLRGRHLSF